MAHRANHKARSLLHSCLHSCCHFPNHIPNSIHDCMTWSRLGQAGHCDVVCTPSTLLDPLQLANWLHARCTMEPHVQSFGCWDVGRSSKKGFESSSFALDNLFVGGITLIMSPLHSLSQHNHKILSKSRDQNTCSECGDSVPSNPSPSCSVALKTMNHVYTQASSTPTFPACKLDL